MMHRAWFISNLLVMCSENTVCMTLVLLNSLKFALWPNTLSNLNNSPCVLEKNMYSVFIDWSVS